MNRIVLAVVGLVVVLGAAGAFVWTLEPGETDADDTLVHRDEIPADFPLAPLAAAEGSLHDVTVRNLSSMTTVTVTYQLAESVDEEAILRRYAALMADRHARPQRLGDQVRASVEGGTLAARVADGDEGRLLTLVAIREE